MRAISKELGCASGDALLSVKAVKVTVWGEYTLGFINPCKSSRARSVVCKAVLYLSSRTVCSLTPASATWRINVVYVIHGLGHSLDKAARQAVELYRITPATRLGVPIDKTTTSLSLSNSEAPSQDVVLFGGYVLM